MELPHIGEHCSEPSCKQLDYLPMKCDACSKIFCSSHLLYDDHSCSSKYKKDIQVPVCPLCNVPVPTPRGTLPDNAVSQHIDQDCKSKPKEKVFTNRCNRSKCKKKELIPLVCDSCRLNFCLSHRHPKDHDCQGPSGARNAAARAAEARMIAKPSSSSNRSSSRTGGAGPSSVQSRISDFFGGSLGSSSGQPARSSSNGSRSQATVQASNANLSEDEALAMALAASLSDAGGHEGGARAAPTSASHTTQEEEDRMLAQALQESERMARSVTTGQAQEGKSCTLS